MFLKAFPVWWGTVPVDCSLCNSVCFRRLTAVVKNVSRTVELHSLGLQWSLFELEDHERELECICVRADILSVDRYSRR